MAVSSDGSATPPGPASLVADFAAGRLPALARAISIVENHRPGSEALLAGLFSRTGRARRVGITGPPGAGKSTLTTRLAAHWRAAGLTVGIIAVDPTSPFTGGALLGDRIRMEAVALDPGIYIRSMATRGSLGGLASTTRDVADLLDAFGFDRVLVETVGVGQTELDVARTTDTVAVVLVPESGDAIQTLKAGLMEIADLFIVNKGDRPGAERLRQALEVMLGMRLAPAAAASGHHAVAPGAGNLAYVARRASAAGDPDRWTPPVLLTVAAEGTGIDEVAAALDRHVEYLAQSGELARRRRDRLRERVVEAAERELRRRLWTDPSRDWLEGRLASLESGALTPLSAAMELLDRATDHGTAPLPGAGSHRERTP